MATERAPQRTPSGDLELHADETVGIRVQDTCLVIRGKNAGRGVLFVTSQRVAWLSDTGPSFVLSYLSIVLHALSSDPQTCDKPCLYCQIKGDDLPVLANGYPVRIASSDPDEAVQDAEESADDEAMAELKFIPDDSSCLQRLFAVLSEMAALHPDPDSADLEGDEEELFDEATLRRQGWEFVENEAGDTAGNGI